MLSLHRFYVAAMHLQLIASAGCCVPHSSPSHSPILPSQCCCCIFSIGANFDNLCWTLCAAPQFILVAYPATTMLLLVASHGEVIIRKFMYNRFLSFNILIDWHNRAIVKSWFLVYFISMWVSGVPYRMFYGTLTARRPASLKLCLARCICHSLGSSLPLWQPASGNVLVTLVVYTRVYIPTLVYIYTRSVAPLAPPCRPSRLRPPSEAVSITKSVISLQALHHPRQVIINVWAINGIVITWMDRGAWATWAILNM